MKNKNYYALVNSTNSFGRHSIVESVSTKPFKVDCNGTEIHVVTAVEGELSVDEVRDFVCYEITKEEYETIMNNNGDDIRFEFENNVGKRLIY